MLFQCGKHRLNVEWQRFVNKCVIKTSHACAIGATKLGGYHGTENGGCNKSDGAINAATLERWGCLRQPRMNVFCNKIILNGMWRFWIMVDAIEALLFNVEQFNSHTNLLNAAIESSIAYIWMSVTLLIRNVAYVWHMTFLIPLSAVIG